MLENYEFYFHIIAFTLVMLLKGAVLIHRCTEKFPNRTRKSENVEYFLNEIL